MKPQRLFLAITVLLVSVCFGQNGSGNEAQIVNGTWKLKSIYTTQNVEGPSPSQQKKLLGTNIVLNGRSLEACGQLVPVKSMKMNKISSADFLANTRARFSEVGIAVPVITEIIINDRQSGSCFHAFPLPGQDIYVKDKDEILVDFEGVFYRAVRIAGEVRSKA